MLKILLKYNGIALLYQCGRRVRDHHHTPSSFMYMSGAYTW